MPISKIDAIFPFISILPLVGGVTSAKTFKRVDLPAPLGPIIPIISPLLISKLMFFYYFKCQIFMRY